MRRIPTYIFVLIIFGINSPNALATRPMIEMHEVIAKEGDVFDGVKYPPGTRVFIVDGTNSVVDVFLSQDFEMNGHVIMKGTQLHVPDGKLSCYWSKEGQKVGMITLHKGAQVCFRPDGTLKTIHLDSATKIQSYTYAEHYWVTFHPSGKVAEGKLGKAAVLGGLHLRIDGDISFFPSGKIKCVSLNDGSQFGEYRLAKKRGYDCDAEFWPNGKLKAGVLAETIRINGVTCGPGDISFVESGLLNGCVRKSY